eukprot:scaffold29823_cov129-Isochrysis_galbana.AAC.2
MGHVEPVRNISVIVESSAGSWRSLRKGDTGRGHGTRACGVPHLRLAAASGVRKCRWQAAHWARFT